MDFKSRITVLILLLNITACTNLSAVVSGSAIQRLDVVWENPKVCALRETFIDLTCSYSNITVKAGFWFSPKQKAKWRYENWPEDLALDFDYAGRVSYREMTNFRSTLTIRDVRDGDAGEYHLMLITEKGEAYLSSTAVTLSVTGLQVTNDTAKTVLFCNTSCPLKNQRYHWYINGQYKEEYSEKPLDINPFREDAYTCSAQGFNDVLAPTVCITPNCYNVTYAERRVCVLRGSSVVLSGSYRYPSDHSVSSAFWHYAQTKDSDLINEPHLLNRVEYVVSITGNLTMKMKNLTKEDSGEYRLRFTDGSAFSGRPGVILNITDLQVIVSKPGVALGEPTAVTLTCSSSCTLSDQPNYIWYKNGQLVTNKGNKHKLYLDCSTDSGNYSCAVSGREDLRSPEETVEPCAAVAQESWFWYVAVGVPVFLVLLIIIIIGVLWMRRRKSGSDGGQRSTDSPETLKDEVHYASIRLERTPKAPLSTARKSPANATEDVQYAAVNFTRPTAAP